MLHVLLMLIDLQALPEAKQHRLTPTAFAKSVQSCIGTTQKSSRWCGCVVRGLETFMTEDDWWRALHDETIENIDMVAEVEQACSTATSPRE